ncbi:hypothetical protein BSKO_14049 [Bryopsis sp. KO-2023]|nr:hypothetical protein BSKO_14049 [Bryopsis sp. KO-2023]
MSAAPIEAGAKLLTLVLLHDEERILLGRKKRGFGEGYYNGFGGKVEQGETIQDAAHRELKEECGVNCDVLARIGILWFSFDDNPQPWEVHVFRSSTFRGSPIETDEMAPEWFALAEIPFGKMWADDVFWYPLMLRGQSFKGIFFFQNTHDLVKYRLFEVEDTDWAPLDRKCWNLDSL